MSNERKEAMEAIQAADEALIHLNAARDCLKTAGNWGIVDALGGGFLSTLLKHGKMKDAEGELGEARLALRRFARELGDVDMMLQGSIKVDDFLGFADYFMDGVIADWMMQKRISDARTQVEKAINMVTDIRGQLLRLA